MYRISRSRKESKEEKVATAIGKLMSDFHLDLEAIGKYLAISLPHVIYRRVVAVLEATKYNKTVEQYEERGKYYGDNLRG